MAEESAYGHNKIGAYLDNGAINKLPLPSGSEVTSVIPQVYTNDTITRRALNVIHGMRRLLLAGRSKL